MTFRDVEENIGIEYEIKTDFMEDLLCNHFLN